ncbi:leucine-responsive transcriptional regulator LEU3 [Sugiyamaella lignohabitans]|uniref:Leucine-responsive transcriptional regulator LEU3 n=1 Tax=Sugiyamaella lignohabitans TaxID=796027 RepID=A0A161HNF4_9ASCO|nr:leucine-responsive transcriptional regulator LEU3 [Sugiyamaella lignohabitans]ANB15667.1 leucine-responsive transcriptional regulator LEU3 [Sugiyamaella lignohabitans]
MNPSVPGTNKQGSPNSHGAVNPNGAGSSLSPVTTSIPDPGSSGSTGSLEETTGKRIACIECRQQKVRCDGHEKWPGPCTRCIKRKTECKMEPNFKRTSKRQRMMELEREMEDLKKRTGLTSLNVNSDGTLSPPSKYHNSNGTFNHPPQSQLPIHKLLPSPIYFPQRHDSGMPTHRPEWVVNNWECSPKTIDGFTLSSDTIKNLFKEFVDKYHPFLPVVDVSRGPEQIYHLCPSLFWTIMAVASRRYDKDGELMMQLTPLLNSCLAEITISPVTKYGSIDQSVTQGRAGISRHDDDSNTSRPASSNTNTVLNLASVYSVQAFLICTMWPPLTSTISADSSWNSAGIAMFNSIRVGLHCPGYARDFGRIKQDNAIYPKITEQVRTWICCNIVSQSVAGMFGFPSFTSFDATVLSACRVDSGIDIPESIRLMMTIQRLENEIEKGLNSNLKDPLGLSELSERLSIIQMMAQKLDELELSLSSSSEFDESRRFMFLVSRVHLMTYYFLDNDRLNSFQRQRGLVQAYNAALALLDHSDNVCRRDKDFIRYLPQVYIQLLWQSATIVNKIYHSQYAQYVDAHAGRALYIATVQHIGKASILKHDVSYRAAEIMQQIWQVYDALVDRPDPHDLTLEAKVSIRTRMAASVFFDCLWTMREQCEIRSVAPAILNQRTTSTPDNVEESLPENNTSTSVTGLSGRSMTTTPTSSLHQQQPTTQQLSTIPLTYPVAQEHVDITSGSISNNAGIAVSLSNSSVQQPQPVTAPNVPLGVSGSSTPISLAPFRPVSATASAIRDQPNSPSLGGVGSMTLTPGTTATSTPTQANRLSQQPISTSSNNPANGTATGTGFEWDYDLVWKDVDSMMNDFGFRVEEVASFM